MKRTYGLLREAIKRKFATLDEFSGAVGISRASVSKKLNGVVAFTQTDIEKICAALDIPINKVSEYFFY